jgi:amino acid adenylation domain-containing protein
LFLGGERIPAPLLVRTAECFPDVEVWNLYGPTEATANAAAGRASESTDSIGRPIAGARLRILDERSRPVPVGVTGRLHIGGPGLARGYLGMPAQTADRFRPDPFGPAGSRLYDTGDQARCLPDGRIEFVGRRDLQVKVRGFRIELEGVEAALRDVSGVIDAAVAVAGDGARLVAYVVGDPTCTAARLHTELTRVLPTYSVPADFFAVAALPRTATGKLDRLGLADVPVIDREQPGRSVGPLSPIEEQLAVIWARLLEVDGVRANDSFFALGGHSLLVIRLMARVRDAFGVDLVPQTVFETPLLRDFAGRVEQALRERRGVALPPLVPVRREEELPLSFAQQRLWILDRLEPGNPRYNVVAGRRVRGPLDLDAARRAVAGIVRRHEVLRTAFTLGADGQPRQTVLGSVEVALPVREVAGEDELLRFAAEQAHLAFDLAEPPLLRMSVARLSSDDAVLVLVLHHIVCDGFAKAIFYADFVQLYRAYATGGPASLDDLPVQYPDYAVWQRGWLTGDLLDRQVGYWRERLRGLTPLELPTDRPRPAVAAYRGATVTHALTPALTRAVRELALGHNATLFMAVLAGFVTVLGRHAGSHDIAVGTPVANRSHSELEQLIGFFVNTVVLRTDLSGDPSFAELLARVRAGGIDAYANADVPFERLVEELAPQRSRARSPLFQVLVANIPPDQPELRLTEGSVLAPVELESGAAMFDLTLSIMDDGDRLWLFGNYDLDLFTAATVRGLLRHLSTLLGGAVADPSRRISALPLVAGADRDAVLAAGTPTVGAPLDERCLHQLVRDQAAATPGAVALADHAREWTYAQVDASGDALAQRLADAGAGLEDRVLVGVSHSVNLIVALLGVLKSGAVYVPVDPALAEERVAAVLAASGPVVVLCDPGGTTLWRRMGFVGPVLEVPGEPRAGRPVDRGVTPANAAYVIYTSGTTGRPKGAVNTHAGLRNSLARLHDDVPLGPDDVVLTKTPSMFDVSLWELLWPLCHGARAVVAEPHTYLDPWQLARLVREHDVTTVQFVPSLVGAFLDVFLDARTGPVAALRRVLCIGEALPADLRDRFAAALPDVALYNLYGPAEAAVHVTAWRCDSDSGVVPIGPPIAGIRAHVLDEALHPVPFGVVGELYLGGVGLARGYLDAPDLTADKFIPDPFGPPGERLYATGDRAVARADGILEFRGRSDDEIKVRGIRVDARQIEVTLLADPAVAEAVVVARSAASGEQALVAYVVSMAGAEVDQQRLLGLLRAELPGGPLPAAVTVLPELPRLISGKLDRRALPEPQWTVERGDFTTPEEGWESGLAEIWSRVLGQVVGRDDDFFALGGHSLLMIQVVARVREALGAEISPHALTTAPRLRDFAVAVARASARQGAAVPIEPAARDRPPVLSFAQQRLWITDRMRPDVPLHQVIAARRVYGELDLGAVERAINAVIARHEVLRTGFPAVRGMPSVCIMVDVTAPIEYIDLRRLPGDEREQTLLAEINALAARPFDLTVAPLLRIGAIRLADAEWALVAVLHHIVCDAWSLDVLFADFAAYYADPDADLPALTTRYADYAAWQRARMSGPLAETRLAFWRAQLADLPQLELPTDRPRPSGRPAHRGARVRRVLDRAVLDGLREISRAHGASLFMTTLAGFAVALSRASGQTDFGVGVPATNRERVELERLIGCFANTLVLRMDVSGDPTFAELVDRVRATALAAYAHQDLPFDRLVEELAPVRGAATTAFVRVMLTFAADPGDPVRLPTARLHPMDVDGATALFDLRLLALEESDGLHLVLTYDRDLFDRTTADRLLAHLGELLGRVAAGHDERMSPVMPGPAVLSAPDHRGTPYLPALISANAGRRPHAPAVTCDGETVTYRELVERVNRLSQHLRADGVRAGELVGVYLNRSVDLVVAILGVLHSGAAYLPLDPAYPSRRTHAILADADPATVITTTELSADLPDPLRTVRIDRDADRIGAHQAGVPAGHVVHPDQTAYVIYTSGSTGTPKGVMVSHGQLLRSTQARTAYYRAPVDTFLLVSSLAFDSSVAGLFWTLADGGLLVLPPSEAHRDPKALARIVAEHAVTHTLMIGSWYRAMLDVADGGALGSLRVVIVAGEPLAPSLPTRHTAALPRAAFYNEYGVTEATVWSTVHECAPGDPQLVPVGRAIEGTTLHVLDRELRQVPPGEPGELFLGGAGIALGYLRRAGPTAARFGPDPYASTPGARLYRTGDLARLGPDGTLTLLGRVDNQVKIRGYRVELEEIESVIAAQPGVREAVVSVGSTAGGLEFVGAHLLADDQIDLADLRGAVEARLPDYMVPTAWRVLPELPRTPNGKVDRAALPALTSTDATREAYAPPTTETSRRLAEIWRELFELDQVGVNDDFFALGGHSLLALQLWASIEDEFEVEFALDVLFEAPTVGALAERIDAARAELMEGGP